MKQQMYGLLLFDNPEARNRAVAVFEAAGFSITFLDWVDELDGVVLTPTCWVEVCGLYEGSDAEFLDEMGYIANEADGDVIEAGLLNPPPFPSQDDNDDDTVPANLRG